ncbi:MAG: helix-turn-helix transcriptional regulator [Dehalococcoidia bacterium]
MRADRLIALLLLLQGRGRMSAPAIAHDLEVSVRTVHRDLEALALAGVPIVSVRGPAGGFELFGGFRTQLTGLNDEEVRAIPFLALPGAAALLGVEAARARALLKLEGGLPGAATGVLREARGEFLHDEQGWGPAADRDSLRFLATAIRRRRVVAVASRAATFRPLALVLKAGEWFVLAEDDQGIEAHAVAGLGGLTTTGARFERPIRLDLEGWWDGWVRRAAADRR